MKGRGLTSCLALIGLRVAHKVSDHGPDDFPETLWASWRAMAQERGVSDVDLLTTFTELTARQIAMAASTGADWSLADKVAAVIPNPFNASRDTAGAGRSITLKVRLGLVHV